MLNFPFDVEFEIVKEGWNEYQLSDGARLRTKLTLGKVITLPGVPPEKALDYNFNTQTMVIAYCGSEMKGTPSGRVLTPQDIQQSVVQDVDYDQTRVAVNEYLLMNGIRIKLRLMLTRVGKTDIFTEDGTPLYTVSSQIVPEIKVPPNFNRGTTTRRTSTPVV